MRRLVATIMVALATSATAPAADAGRSRPIHDPVPTPQGYTDCTTTLGPFDDPAIPVPVPRAGTLRIELDGYAGGWGLVVCIAGIAMNADGELPGGPLTTVVRLKAATEVLLRPYNRAGTPDAVLTLTFRPAR